MREAHIRTPWRPIVSDFIEQARLAARAFAEFGGHLLSIRPCGSASPACRAPARPCSSPRWCTVSCAAAAFRCSRRWPSGRIAGARLSPQPDDAVPRFDYERHVRALVERARMAGIDAADQRASRRHRLPVGAAARCARSRSTSSIIPANGCSTCRCSTRATSNGRRRRIAQSRQAGAPRAARRHCLAQLAAIDPLAPADESAAIEAARLFTAYLQACRNERHTLSLAAARPLPDAGRSCGLAGADLRAARPAGRARSRRPARLWAMMRRRYEAYRDVVVRPFFREHFARLDRQIVLVDAARRARRRPRGGARPGRRAGRDPRLLPGRARQLARARCSGRAPTDPVRRDQGRPPAPLRARPAGGDPQAADRARHRARRRRRRRGRRDRARRRARDPRSHACAARAAACRRSSASPCRANGRTAGASTAQTEIAVFPGDLPADVATLFGAKAKLEPGRGAAIASAPSASARRRSSRPPTASPALPHIRLDRALQFLIGDRLR